MVGADNRAVLRIHQLRFRWPRGQRDALDIPELSVARGERVFVRGNSGSGKSTLLGLIAGLMVPNTGSLEVLGQNLAGLGSAKRDQFRADHIGYIFQQFNLIPYLSVLDNILLACRFSARRRQQALQASPSIQQAAVDLMAHLQLDPAEFRHRPARELSVGQQQRVAAVRALIGAPELLIADEPTSALDADARKGFIALLMKECEANGSTLLFVSHDPSLEGFFDRSIDLPQVNRADQSREVVSC